MSTAITPDYSKVDQEKRAGIIKSVQEKQESEEQLSLPDAEEVAEARQTLAAEEQPGEDGELPDLRETTTVEFRGHEFEFGELGDRLLKAAQLGQGEDEVKAGTETGEYVYKTLGECGIGTTEEYWRQYNIQGSGDTDGVVSVFEALIEESVGDIDPEQMERAQKFRSE